MCSSFSSAARASGSALSQSRLPGSFTITNDITFNITTGGNLSAFILDEWVISDLGGTVSPLSPNLQLSINGVSMPAPGGLEDNPGSLGDARPTPHLGAGLQPMAHLDPLAASPGTLSANDGLLFDDLRPLVALNNTVTLQAGTYTLSAHPGFNPQATQIFTGNMFLVNNAGNRISNIVSAGAIPEPSSTLLLILPLAGLLAWRERRRFARLAGLRLAPASH